MRIFTSLVRLVRLLPVSIRQVAIYTEQEAGPSRFFIKSALVLAITISLHVLFFLVGFLLFIAGPANLVIPIFCFLCLIYGWMLFTFFHYRQARQEEFLQLLTTAAESGVPLAPVLRAYIHDRPQGTLREFWVAFLLFFVVPGYYWLWHRRHNYDRKVEEVAQLLEVGIPLHEALRATPGVASRELMQAATVGQSTGKLALALRHSTRQGFGTVWLEVLPRLLYPVFLLSFMIFILGFWMTFLLPRLERILQDFHQDLPPITAGLMIVGTFIGAYSWGLAVLLMGTTALVVLLLTSPTTRWYFPGVRFLYRMSMRARVLQMLAILLDAGKTVPDALVLLADSGYFPRLIRSRLHAIQGRVVQGEPLADSLRRGGLIPPSMVALVQAAERVRNLPWALAEMGNSLASRTVRLLRRFTLITFPASVVAVGVLVGFMVVGMFIPLVTLISRLSE